MAKVARENIGVLHDRITVTVSKEDYIPAFEKSLKAYSKNANIPGFRKGMVPAGMIKKMYGQSVYTDEVLRTVEKELNNYLTQENPEIFAQPLPLTNGQQLNMNAPADYQFDFEIGLKPAIETAPLAKAKLTLHKVEATDEMVNEEINRMQIKGGNMTEPETIDNDENVINVMFSEADEAGVAVEGGIQKENSVLLKYFSKTLQKQLKGKKKGDTLTFQLEKSFDDKTLPLILQDLGFAKDDAEAAKKYFNLEIVKLGLVEKRELDEAFFKEVYPDRAIATADEFKAAIKEEIQNYWNGQSSHQLQDQIYHYLVDETKVEFPDAFLKRWLEKGGEKPKTAEEVEKEYPSFVNSLKWTLISDKMINDNKLEVSNEELKAFMRQEIMGYFGQMQMGGDTSWIDSYVDRMMKDEKQIESSYRRLLTTKLFSWAEGEVKPKEKKVSPEELNAMQHNHQH